MARWRQWASGLMSRSRSVITGVAATVGAALAVGLYAAGEVLATTSSTTPRTPDEEAVDTALSGLRRSRATWKAPSELRLHEQAEIQLLVSAGSSIRNVRPKLNEIGRTQGAQIYVSDTMLATLSGLSFAIEDRSEAEQYVAKDGQTTWTWSIEPTRTGKQHLHLTLSAVITLQGRGAPYTIKTFEQILTVNVTWPTKIKTFIDDNWQWLWTTLLLPVVGLVWRRNRGLLLDADA
jgi:hypothetical protein